MTLKNFSTFGTFTRCAVGGVYEEKGCSEKNKVSQWKKLA